MNKLLGLILSLLMITSCGENSNDKGARNNLEVNRLESLDFFEGVKIKSAKVNGVELETKVRSKSLYELAGVDEELGAIRNDEKLILEIELEEFKTKIGYRLDEINFSLVDGHEEGFRQDHFIGGNSNTLRVVIEGKEKVFNFLGRKKYLSVTKLVMLDDLGNVESINLEDEVPLTNMKCPVGYYKGDIREINEVCPSSRIVGKLDVYENRAIVQDKITSTNVSKSRSGSSVSIATDYRRHDLSLKGFEYTLSDSIQVSNMIELLEYDLSAKNGTYFIGLSHYENSYGFRLDSNIDMGRSGRTKRYHDSQNGKWLNKNSFGRNVSYEIDVEANIEMIIFE